MLEKWTVLILSHSPLGLQMRTFTSLISKWYNFYYPDFFCLKNGLERGSPFPFILFEETRVNFETSTLLPGKVIKIAITTIWTTKGAFITAAFLYRNVMRSAKQGNYLKTTVLYFQLTLSHDRNILSSLWGPVRSLGSQDSIHSVEFQHVTWLDI